MTPFELWESQAWGQNIYVHAKLRCVIANLFSCLGLGLSTEVSQLMHKTHMLTQQTILQVCTTFQNNCIVCIKLIFFKTSRNYYNPCRRILRLGNSYGTQKKFSKNLYNNHTGFIKQSIGYNYLKLHFINQLHTNGI